MIALLTKKEAVMSKIDLGKAYPHVTLNHVQGLPHFFGYHVILYNYSCM